MTIEPNEVEIANRNRDAARANFLTMQGSAAVLAARVKKLESALRPFAEYMKDGGDLDNKGNPLPSEQGVGWIYLTMGDFRAATLAMSAGQP